MRGIMSKYITTSYLNLKTKIPLFDAVLRNAISGSQFLREVGAIYYFQNIRKTVRALTVKFREGRGVEIQNYWRAQT